MTNWPLLLLPGPAYRTITTPWPRPANLRDWAGNPRNRYDTMIHVIIYMAPTLLFCETAARVELKKTRILGAASRVFLYNMRMLLQSPR